MAENDLTKYTGKDWDAENIAIAVDGVAPDIYASSGDMFSVTWNADNVTIAVDAKGNGMRAINHNGAADIVLNVSRMSNIWAYILEDNNNYRTSQHQITIHTDAEQITTTTANISRIPEITGNGDVPNAQITFHCIDATAHAVN